MTKKRAIILTLLIITVIGILYFWRKDQSVFITTPEKSPAPVVTIQERSFIGPDKKEITPTSPEKLNYANIPSPDWEEKLVESIKVQAPSVKKIQITKEASLVWMRDGNNLLVESVVVAVTNQNDEESSFRALIDSETGKVLETWDRSITDPLNPRSRFKLKLDPRYNQ